jgi:acid phosphatase class B
MALRTKRSRRIECTKRMDLLQKLASSVISFDFDDTLYSSGSLFKKDEDEYEEAGWKKENLDKIRDYLKQGYNVVVVTSRIPSEAEEANKMLQEIGLNLDVISAPGYEGPSKSDVLIDIGAIKHYDDFIDSEDLKKAKEAGIEIIQVESGRTDV